LKLADCKVLQIFTRSLYIANVLNNRYFVTAHIFYNKSINYAGITFTITITRKFTDGKTF